MLNHDHCRLYFKVNEENMYKFLCPICEKGFASNTYLVYHLKSCQDGKYDFSCNQCAYKTNNRRYFTVHQQIHASVKYECTICQCQLSSEASLRNHRIRLHSNKLKKYTCNLCDRAFITHKELLNHSNTHTDTNDIEEKCEHCDYKATEKGYLKIHIQSKHEGI